MNIIIAFSAKLILSLVPFLLVFHSYAQETSDDTNSSTSVPETIGSEYHPSAILISETGLIEGRDAIKSYLTDLYKNQGARVDYKTSYKIPVLQVLEYEIGLSRMEIDGQYAHSIVWSVENGSGQKIAEVIFESTNNVEIPDELTTARKKWVRLCNEHNARKLVETLYTEDAIYYNRGRVLNGHEQLSREYSYMNDTSYTLQLNPKHVEMVREDLVFEIGQCSGSYPLPYLLVWKKQKDGDWKVYFDSNY